MDVFCNYCGAKLDVEHENCCTQCGAPFDNNASVKEYREEKKRKEKRKNTDADKRCARMSIMLHNSLHRAM